MAGASQSAAGPRLDFSGRRVLIAGGSKGIGRAMALAFAAAALPAAAQSNGSSGAAQFQAGYGAARYTTGRA
ncbi:MAG: hypothetical protein ACK4FW_08085, partial [Stenotrophomonas sp.]